MTPEQWEKAGQLYQAALELKPEARADFLNQACGGDETLRREVESLLAADGQVGDFLGAGAMGDAAKMLAQNKSLSLIGRKLGPYQVLALIGAGGMGEVYQARDARLNRDVAIKVLPASFAKNADRLRRFEQEARATSALNHPNILTVYDIGAASPELGGAPYIVEELLEGEELRAQLQQGALSQRRAMDYAQQIARGLAAAHERGIVHRDLKPENLFITKDGRVKILDFGLAKLKSSSIGCAIDTDAPTQKKMTDPGTVLGTVGYMSPEQVRGEEADHRADIFAFGVILHEMLSGQRPFKGNSAVEVMNAILKEEPPELVETNARLNPQLDRIVRRCLEKCEQQRFQSTSDLAFDLEMLSGQSGLSAKAAASVSSRMRERLLWMAASAVLLLAALLFALGYFHHAPSAISVTRFQVALREKPTFFPMSELASLSVSPDGCCLAFVATSDGQRNLWLRRLDAVEAQILPGTAEALAPFWSPDSRFIAFFAEGNLKKVAAVGGAPQTICELPATCYSGAWGNTGTILLGGSAPDFKGVYRVSDNGGAVRPLLKVDQPLAYWLDFLPDGQHFLYFSFGKEKQKGVYIGSLNSAETRLLLPSNSRAEYAPPGYLLFAREGSLVAQPFDADKLRLSGEPFTVVEQMTSFDNTGWAEFSVSDNGVLAYYTNTNTSFSWFDRGGRQSAAILKPDLYDQHRLSPDARRVAFSLANPRTGRDSLWISEATRDTSTRISFTPTDNSDPVWSPDGRRLAFFSFRGVGKTTLVIKDLNDTGEGERPLPDEFQVPTDWSLDGQYLAYTERQYFNGLPTEQDIWFFPLFGDRKPIRFMGTRFSESHARFSPNRRWVGYVSDESGREEVYVRAFDGTGEKMRVSVAGGSRPCWRHDGTELFYLSGDNKLMAVPVQTGSSFEHGEPVALFRIASPGWNDFGNAFDAAPDGQRFLIQTGVTGAPSLPFTVVVHWNAGIKP